MAVCACWRRPDSYRVAVARVFALVVRCRIMMLFVYSRVGKNRDTRRECPAEAGPAGWFLPGGFSRKAGPIKHQLVLVCRSGGSARKNQSQPIAYTDLLCVRALFLFTVKHKFNMPPKSDLNFFRSNLSWGPCWHIPYH